VTLLPTREGIRMGLVPSLVGRVRVGLLYSKNKTLQFTIPCLKTLNLSMWVKSSEYENNKFIGTEK
jgi:hypothetical protein